MNYERLIDAETWDFIACTQAHYPPEAVTLSVAEQRAIYDRMCRAFFAGYPQGVRTRDVRAADVPCRLYEGGPAEATVVYFHGGGFVVGGLESHDDVCAEICAATGFRVVSVDYRLCPEHPHPAAFEDALAATAWAGKSFGEPLVLAGDSAGGNLAAAVAQAMLGREPAIAGQVLIYPGLGGDRSRGSYVEHAEAPMLTTSDVLYYERVRHGGGTVPEDHRAAPLRAGDFAGLPPAALFVAECDPLSDDGRAYRDALAAAGVPVRLHEEKGLVHGYLRARRTVRRAADSFGRIVEAIGALGRGEPFP